MEAYDTQPSASSEELRLIPLRKYKYNPASPSGLIFARSGKPCGTLRKDGYWSTQSRKKNLQVHRLVWIANFGAIPPGMEIDHIDRNPSNNLIENLRLVSRSQNGFNRRVPRQSQTGQRYIHTCRKTGNFTVRIARVSYGTFPTLEEALEVRDSLIKTH
ncbi:HNH endonuclease [Erwinia phage vB_EamP-L1]|uniref:HNH endonuclease n=1 Tax=Erwinia phage vB_EamP-L1 TaxID=1051673 RepID=G0YQ51_9CAUD|nr:HNH endonuclease [Erwinia phage vB_EamP-L1]AEJ81478.1 HNH endonuclease [Erwinia phage vB_EamP-L1]